MARRGKRQKEEMGTGQGGGRIAGGLKLQQLKARSDLMGLQVRPTTKSLDDDDRQLLQTRNNQLALTGVHNWARRVVVLSGPGRESVRNS